MFVPVPGNRHGQTLSIWFLLTHRCERRDLVHQVAPRATQLTISPCVRPPGPSAAPIDVCIRSGSMAANTGPTICLNMIVRDEAHVVLETLRSVVGYIDSWVIVDTGLRRGGAGCRAAGAAPLQRSPLRGRARGRAVSRRSARRARTKRTPPGTAMRREPCREWPCRTSGTTRTQPG